jgi:glycosyltransferase involved in cell wall biosynthesis
MEALGLGRPVLATYVAGIPELVEPGRSGWLVAAGSVDTITDGIREVLSTPIERLEAMGREGRQAVREQHDVRESAARLHQLFARYVSGCELEPARRAPSAPLLSRVGT